MTREVKAQKNCAGCKYWASEDRTLDEGRVLLGTCNYLRDYAQEVYAVKRASGWRDDEFVRNFKQVMRDRGAMLQVAGVQIGDARAYLRTGPTELCSWGYESKVPVVQESMTQKGLSG